MDLGAVQCSKTRIPCGSTHHRMPVDARLVAKGRDEIVHVPRQRLGKEPVAGLICPEQLEGQMGPVSQ